MNMRKLLAMLLLSLIAVAMTLPLFAQMRGLTINAPETGEEIPLYQGSYALVIGASDYANGWPNLPGVKEDLSAVKAALEKQGFDVTVVENPNQQQLQQAFTDFISQYGQTPENRLLFYFAGHGHTLRLAYGGEMGYIVPVDAPNPNNDEAGFIAKALDMQMIEVYAKRIQAKHAFFLFDSCFSGSIFSLSRAVPENISYKTAKPVRQFLTSGSAEETVPDKSIFRQQFIAALDGEADANKDGYVTGTELSEFMQTQIINYSQGSQHPQYGKIRHPMLDKGDFVFKLEVSATISAGTSAAPETPASTGGADPETEMWSLVKNSTETSDVKDFLDAYPDGKFAKAAQLKLKQLERNSSQIVVATPEQPADQSGQMNPQGAIQPQLDIEQSTSTDNSLFEQGVLEFAWDGEDCWVVNQGDKQVASQCGSTSVELAPGRYTISPMLLPFFTPTEVTIQARQTASVKKEAGILDVKWAENECWGIYRGEQEVTSFCGSAAQMLEVGKYTVKPAYGKTFDPIDVTIETGQTATIEPGGQFEFEWAGSECWTVYRDKKEVRNGCGSDVVALVPGTYLVKPSGKVLEPFEITIEAGKTTTVKRPSGTFDFQWPGDECWSVYRRNESIGDGCGSVQLVLTPGTYRVETMQNVFAPFEIAIEAGKTLSIKKTVGNIEIKWEYNSCWTLQRQQDDIMTSCGNDTTHITLEPGAYKFVPDQSSGLSAMDVTIHAEKTTTIVASGGKIEVK